MNQEEYNAAKTVLKTDEDRLEYEILRYIETNIFTDSFVFSKLYDELYSIAKKYEVKKMYEFMKFHEYENIKPCNRSEILNEIQSEFNKNIINSTKNYSTIDF